MQVSFAPLPIEPNLNDSSAKIPPPACVGHSIYQQMATAMFILGNAPALDITAAVAALLLARSLPGNNVIRAPPPYLRLQLRLSIVI
jgi:hypothetical protein